MSKQENAFKVGSVYRQRNGALARVTRDRGDGTVQVESVFFPNGTWMNGGGARKQRDGTYYGSGPGVERDCDLLPGELHQVNGQWVPAEEAKTYHYFSGPSHLSDTVRLDGIADLMLASIRRAEQEADDFHKTNSDVEGRAPLPFFIEQQERARFDPVKGFEVSFRTTENHAIPFGRVSLDGPVGFKAPKAL